MLKQAASWETLNDERKAMFTSAFNDSLAAALLDGLFGHPASP
jgi:hypothetical protein